MPLFICAQDSQTVFPFVVGGGCGDGDIGKERKGHDDDGVMKIQEIRN